MWSTSTTNGWITVVPFTMKSKFKENKDYLFVLLVTTPCRLYAAHVGLIIRWRMDKWNPFEPPWLKYSM